MSMSVIGSIVWIYYQLQAVILGDRKITFDIDKFIVACLKVFIIFQCQASLIDVVMSNLFSGFSLQLSFESRNLCFHSVLFLIGKLWICCFIFLALIICCYCQCLWCNCYGLANDLLIVTFCTCFHIDCLVSVRYILVCDRIILPCLSVFGILQSHVFCSRNRLGHCDSMALSIVYIVVWCQCQLQLIAVHDLEITCYIT